MEKFYEWESGHVYSPLVHKLKPNSGYGWS